MTALGLHREAGLAYTPASALSPSFTVSEFRRRLFCHIFISDKQLSTLMGRPPAFSRRYITSKMPLDLSDTQVLAEGQELEDIKSRLDPMGWNVDGECHFSTVCRAWMMMALIRDEVLELSLGLPDEACAMIERRK